jgi:hypothetical protein
VKKRRFSVEQITSVLQQVAGGIAVGEVSAGTRASKAKRRRQPSAVTVASDGRPDAVDLKEAQVQPG